MSEKDYLQDLTEIKSILNKSTRFISLNGLSGIFAGVYALLGATLGNYLINSYQSHYAPAAFLPITYFELLLAAVAGLVLLFSVASAYFLTRQKTLKNNEKIWSTSSKRLLQHFMIPLITGGLFCIILHQNSSIGLIAPCTLIFYGFTCINTSKYTIGTIKYLGITEVLIGLISTQFIEYSLCF